MELYRKLLKEFIALKSISTDKTYQDDINATADWLKSQFESNGFEVNLIEGYDNPIVLASYTASPQFETCLVYGHYDVQPAEKSDGWESEPFDVAERDGRLYARGIVDNKGQVLIHMVNVFELIKEGNLQYNVKFMIEGNEETGSPNLEAFFNDNKDLLKADLVMISDGELKEDYPTVALGFRGGFNTTVKVVSSTTDLHSGIFGGATPSSSTELSKLLSGLFNNDGSVAIEGFYDDVDPISDETLARNSEAPFSLDNFKSISGAKAMLTEQNFDYYTQTGLRPAVIITGIQSGYNGEGYRNGIPSSSTAKINFRLVSSQKPDDIVEKFKAHVKKVLPDYVDHTIEISMPYEGIRLSPDNKYVQGAEKALEEIYGKKVVFEYSGGGLPIVTLFDQAMGVSQLIVNLGNEDCAVHAANENFKIDILEKGMSFSKRFFSKS